MKVAYFDCFAGISGDMILGAMLDLGLPLEVLKEGWEKVGLRDVKVKVQRVRRKGIEGVKINFEAQAPRRGPEEIKALIRQSSLSPWAKEIAEEVFSRLEEAERKIHGLKGKVHFHELGDPDTILDVVGAAIGIEYFGWDEVISSPLPLSRGWVQTEHGPLPLPCPATLALLEGVPVETSSLRMEMVTPTGAAILTTVAKGYGPFPSMRVEKVGYGAGDRDPEEMPNLLRIVTGEKEAGGRERLWILEADIDDMNPELFPHLEDRLRREGAVDVLLVPVQMKKGRPGVTVRLLCHEGEREKMMEILFSESTTLGIRAWAVQRATLRRKVIEVSTRYGPVEVKVAFGEGERLLNIAPEYESCRRLALEQRVPLKEVYQEAVKAAKETLGACKPTSS